MVGEIRTGIATMVDVAVGAKLLILGKSSYVGSDWGPVMWLMNLPTQQSDGPRVLGFDLVKFSRLAKDTD